ncbi:class-II fumarase/aspartase family protein [Methylobacterium trifolii]|uniref:3-carboxy-cis,cis-muconate cycloisomerase n=1 Tax=Methylobacterium trifolii TaxID=1003092 RepID=A0ABQ4TZU8_9HYPH|nr:adenylosuccinate lyase family protein [Methylobacterium trifolii]GJE59587.1 3-carboxy-cis,cis-muconate cycloisomerase [Methylobacterium trifolii]
MAFSSLDSALLGPLFATEPMRAVFADEARVAAMLRAEAALARAQGALGLVPAALPEALEALPPGTLDPAVLGQRTALSGVPVIPFVKAVQKALPPELEAAFHKGATTQDIADTGLVLQLREAFALVEAELPPIVAGLAALAARHRETPCVGRTYGQQAAPVSFGYKAAIWGLGIAEVAARAPQVRARMLTASLGGPVGTLAGLGAQAEAVAAGFADACGLGYDPVVWHTRRARVAETGAWLAQLMGSLAKFATDVVSLASTEVGEVAEPHVPGRGGSSAMPHKRNPVGATIILAAFTAAKGHAATLLDAMPAAHERPAGPWHAEWHALPQLFGLASGALREARTLAEGLGVDAARMRANLDITHGLLFADSCAARLSPRLGAATAHGLVEKAAGRMRDGGDSLRAVLEAMPETAGTDLASAFDLAPALAAAARVTDRALAEMGRLVPAAVPSPTSAAGYASPCP